jgi:hypothetical protein
MVLALASLATKQKAPQIDSQRLLRFKANGRRICGPPAASSEKRLDGFQIGCLRAARIGLNVERDALSLDKAAHSSGLYGRGMDKHVLPAAFRRNKSKTFGGVEELYGSDGH